MKNLIFLHLSEEVNLNCEYSLPINQYNITDNNNISTYAELIMWIRDIKLGQSYHLLPIVTNQVDILRPDIILNHNYEIFILGFSDHNYIRLYKNNDEIIAVDKMNNRVAIDIDISSNIKEMLASGQFGSLPEGEYDDYDDEWSYELC